RRCCQRCQGGRMLGRHRPIYKTQSVESPGNERRKRLCCFPHCRIETSVLSKKLILLLHEAVLGGRINHPFLHLFYSLLRQFERLQPRASELLYVEDAQTVSGG